MIDCTDKTVESPNAGIRKSAKWKAIQFHFWRIEHFLDRFLKWLRRRSLAFVS